MVPANIFVALDNTRYLQVLSVHISDFYYKTAKTKNSYTA